jgi:hypothetical protein
VSTQSSRHDDSSVLTLVEPSEQSSLYNQNLSQPKHPLNAVSFSAPKVKDYDNSLAKLDRLKMLARQNRL